MKKSIYIIFTVSIVFNIILLSLFVDSQNTCLKNYRELSAYKNYYIASENVLSDLDLKYHWSQSIRLNNWEKKALNFQTDSLIEKLKCN